MPNPLGYYFYFRGNIDGLVPAARRPATKRLAAGSVERRQSLGLLLIAAAICVPIILTGAIAFALKLLT